MLLIMPFTGAFVHPKRFCQANQKYVVLKVGMHDSHNEFWISPTETR